MLLCISIFVPNPNTLDPLETKKGTNNLLLGTASSNIMPTLLPDKFPDKGPSRIAGSSTEPVNEVERTSCAVKFWPIISPLELISPEAVIAPVNVCVSSAVSPKLVEPDSSCVVMFVTEEETM